MAYIQTVSFSASELSFITLHFIFPLLYTAKNSYLKPVADFMCLGAWPCLRCGTQTEQRSANSD